MSQTLIDHHQNYIIGGGVLLERLEKETEIADKAWLRLKLQELTA